MDLVANNDGGSESGSFSSHHFCSIEVAVDASGRLYDEQTSNTHFAFHSASDNQLFGVYFSLDHPSFTDLEEVIGVDLASEDPIYPNTALE